MSQNDLIGLSEINALLGAGTEYEGKLVFQGRVRIDGRFVGEIHGDEILILGGSAEVHANVEVGTLIVNGGRLYGDVVARQVVEIHAPGEVHGDIQTPQLFIEKGVVFEGQCAMGPDPSEIHELDGREAMLSALRGQGADAGATVDNADGSEGGDEADAGGETEVESGSSEIKTSTQDAIGRDTKDEMASPFVPAPPPEDA